MDEEGDDSRVTTHGKPLVAVDLQTAFDRALANLRSTIDERDAVIDAVRMPIVLGDESQLTQLLQNLISNALKYGAHERPKIVVRTMRSGDAWTISVRDNGIGIAPQYHERIFRVFQRLHSRGEYSGTGIGLAVCKSIVDRHGGRIWVDSQEGGGATFSFTLHAACGGDGVQ